MAARCTVGNCGWKTDVESRHISGCLATWHVFETHPKVWRQLFGDMPPRDPDPRTKQGMAEAIVEEWIG